MCGIAGIYNSNQSSGALRQVGDRMVALLHHRGPDARGVEIRSTRDGSRVMLAHTRLSIIDLSEDSSQPMSFGDETLWIVFNGEIYNYQELKSDLQKLGVQFSVNNITGFPTETRKLAFDTIEINRHINADNQNIYSFVPFHGTPLRKTCEDLGYEIPEYAK